MPVIHEAFKFAPGTDLTGKSWAVRIIEGDRQGSSAYYPRQVLEKAAPLFAEKTRVYADHPSLSEREDRPERSIRDLVGYLSEGASFDGKDLVGQVTFLPSQIERMRELAESGLIGLSIRAEGRFAEDGKSLAEFTRVHSVDVVTQAGAGGEFRRVTESAASESGADNREEQEHMDEIKEAVAALTASVSGLVEAFNADRQERKDAEAAALAESQRQQESNKPALSEVVEAAAELTEAGRKAVLDAFEAGKDYKPVLEAEKAREDAIRESLGNVRKGHVQDLNEADDDFGKLIFG